MKLFRRFIAMLFAVSLATSQVRAANSYDMPEAGPMSFGDFVSIHLNPALVAIAGCHIGSSAPVNGPGSAATPGQCWWDNTTTTWIDKVYDGTTWIERGRLNTSANTFTPTIAGTNVTSVTGTGAAVLATSPTLVTPNLGTPSAATLTNATGLPVASGISGLGTGVATVLATPSSANLAAAITGETGSGALVFGTSPALTTPNLGTPSAATLTNATGLPIASGISGLGTGVATWLATPSSANLASAVTGDTGSGALVFGISPTIATPAVTGSATFTGGAVTASAPVLDVTQTWNSGAVAFTGIKSNITDTASAAGSLLMDLQRGGTSMFTVRKDGAVNAGSGFISNSASGFFIGARGQLVANADGVFQIRNNAGTDFGRLQLGGTTSSFPAIKRNTTGIDIRLADDSGYAPLAASTFTGSIKGTTTNDNAAAGDVGEYIASSVSSGSAVSLTSGTNAAVTSISLSAGDWDVVGEVAFNRGTGTTISVLRGGTSQTSGMITFGDNTRGGAAGLELSNVTSANAVAGGLAVPTARMSLATTTTVYLNARGDFAVSTLGAFGYITARRVR